MNPIYIHPLQRIPKRTHMGSKAQKLRFLQNYHISIPVTYVCTWDAYQRYVADDVAIVDVLRNELAAMLDPQRSYAVRSSANVEDQPDFSFAGQFKSVLDARGVDDVLHAIWSVWATAQSAGVQAYLRRHSISPDRLRMAVVIQEMVPAAASGVAFSKNPITGTDQIVVEAVPGQGTALVQAGITPERWIYQWGTWVQQPAHSDLDPSLVRQIVAQVKAIARAYGKPVDLEWVYDGQQVYWVQLREITSLGVHIYSNRMSKEMLPGLIKPLVWSVNVPLVVGEKIKLFTELIGPNDLAPNDLARQFYYRAYFSMSGIGDILELLGMPREGFELMMGIAPDGPDKPSFKPSARTLLLMPRMAAAILRRLNMAGQIERFLPSARAALGSFYQAANEQRTARELLDQIPGLSALLERVTYYDFMALLLLQIFTMILKGQLGKEGVDWQQFDLARGLDQLQEYDPHPHLAALHRQYAALPEPLQARIRRATWAELPQIEGCEDLCAGISRLLDRFGHLSDSGNDFSVVPWRETPDMVLDMILNYVQVEEGRAARPGFDELALKPLSRLAIGPIYRRARQFRLYREATSSLFTYGYGLFRIYFLAIADHMVKQGRIAEREDIFYLSFEQVQSAVLGSPGSQAFHDQIARVKLELSSCRQLVPPAIVYGDQEPAIQVCDSDVLTGVPTSRGQYTGPVKVVQGIQDLAKVADGDVLVIPYSDVGWTPLFARAGAVIAESGGILSHSSIIAREYNIPAVVSVPGACQIQDGTMVTVDGYQGQVLIAHAVPQQLGVPVDIADC